MKFASVDRHEFVAGTNAGKAVYDACFSGVGGGVHHSNGTAIASQSVGTKTNVSEVGVV